MKKIRLLIVSLLPVLTMADPNVSNIRVTQRENTKLVDILYDVTYSQENTVSISCEVSTNSGAIYDIPVASFSGNGYGVIVTTGVDRVIIWNARVDWDENYSEQMMVRITAKARRFTDNGDGTVTDNTTGLMWQKTPLPRSSYPSAVYKCVQLGEGWRLPTLEEMQTLIDTSRTPALPAKHPFTDILHNTWFWTATSTEVESQSCISLLTAQTTSSAHYTYDDGVVVSLFEWATLPVRSIY